MWNFNKFKNNKAVILENGKTFSYAELNCLAQNIVRHILNKENNRPLVFHLCGNELGALAAYVGFLNAHIVPLVLNADLDFALFKSLLTEFLPAYLHLPNRRLQELSTLPESANFETLFSHFGYSLIKTNFKKSYLLNDNLALVQPTSGSTGSHKLVRQSYQNIQANTGDIVAYLHLNETERAITTLPMNYNYGMSVINTHCAVGAALILTDKSIIQREFWQALKTHKATSFAGVPYTFEMLEKLRFFRMDLPHLRYLTQAGGKLSTVLQEKFSKWAMDNGKKFWVMYGATEATARMAYLPPAMAMQKIGSIGIAIAQGKFSLIDSVGNLITTPKTKGELVFEGKNVALGYAEKGDDLAKGDDFHGRLLTGDVANFDEDGFFYIVGRKKRFLKIFGNRVSLDECENLLKTAFPKIDCICSGKDDQMQIFVTPDNAEQEPQLIDFLAQKTNLNKTAFVVKTIAKIPRNAAGKVLYETLQQ